MRDVITKSEKLTDQQEWRLDAVDEHLVSLIDPTSFEADQYRTLRHVLEWKHPTKKVVAVTSALAGDGKTTTALNLAGALAHAPGVRVLICDLDMRTPSVGKRLGLVPQSPGLVDMVLDADLTLGDVVRRHPRFPLSVLPAGRPLTVSTNCCNPLDWQNSCSRRASNMTTSWWIRPRWCRCPMPG